MGLSHVGTGRTCIPSPSGIVAEIGSGPWLKRGLLAAPVKALVLGRGRSKRRLSGLHPGSPHHPLGYCFRETVILAILAKPPHTAWEAGVVLSGVQSRSLADQSACSAASGIQPDLLLQRFTFNRPLQGPCTRPTQQPVITYGSSLRGRRPLNRDSKSLDRG